MKKAISLLVLIMAAGLAVPAGSSTGSMAAGHGVSPRDAYMLGRILTFSKLVCLSACPLQAGELDRERARSLKASLDARNAAKKPGTPDDKYIQVLCPGKLGRKCEEKLDEQELVRYFLTLRYDL